MIRSFLQKKWVPAQYVVLLTGLFCAIASLYGASPASAHPLNNGYSQVTIHDRSVEYGLFIPEDRLLIYDADQDRRLSETELNEQRESIADELRRSLRLQVGATVLPMSLDAMETEERDGVPGIVFHLGFEADQPLSKLTIYYDLLFEKTDPNHLNFLLLINGDDVDQYVFDASHRVYLYESMTAPPDGGSASASIWRMYVQLGMEHIWTGYDHLLFLLSLIITAVRIRQAALYITAFTVAHSITLLLAVLGWFVLPPDVVEPAIAPSIG